MTKQKNEKIRAAEEKYGEKEEPVAVKGDKKKK